MNVCMTQEEFKVIYDALQFVNSEYTVNDAAEVVKRELEAWETVKEIRHRVDLGV